MGACENSFEPHEPLTLAATEQHSCLEFIKDSEQLPVLETAHSLIDTNVEPSSATDGFVDLSQKDNVVCASHSDVKAVSADMGIGLTGEGESVVGLTAGELLEDESGVIGGCLDERQSGIDDFNGETDRSREEKAGLGVQNGEPLDCERSLELLERNCDQQDGRVDDKKTGVQGVTEEESDGLVTVEADTSDEVVPSTSCETSVESILANDMTRNCDQQDDQNDHESGSVQGVMEEKNDGLAAIKIVNSDEIVLSLGSEMPTELMQAKDWSRNGDQQDDQRDDKNVSVQGVMEQHSSGLAPIEFDDIHDEIVLSSGQGMPAELLPEKGLPSDGNEQYKHDCGTSQEAVMEEKIDNLTGLENSDLQAVMEQKRDGLVATKTADTCENILPSLGYEMPAERLPRNGVEKDKQDRSTSMVLTMEERNNDLAGIESISMEGFMEEKSDGLAAIETATLNEIGPLSGCEIPAGLISVNGYGVELDKQYDGTSPTVVPKERSVLLTRLETDNQDQILPSLDHGMHLESTTVTCPPSKCLQPDDQKGDQIISCLIAGGVMEETSDALDVTDTTTSNWLLSSQGLERTLKLMPMTGLPEESVYHDEQELIPSELDSKVVNVLAIERVPEQESDASARIGADIYAQVSPHGAIDSNSAGDCSGETVNEAKNHVSIDSVSETKCHDIASPSSQRSNGVRKSSRKAQTKRAARKSRNTTKVPNLHLGIETVFKSVTRKRSCLSKPARSSAWGLLGNITHAFTMIDGPRLDEIENNGSQKARGGRGSRKRNNRAGGRSQRSSKKGYASASCIRLKVKVGKEACQTEANPKIMIPEVIDTKASAELVSNYGVESYQETSFEMSKLVHYAEDNVAEEGAGKQLQSFDIKLKKAELHCDPYGMDVNLANKDMEGMVIFEKSPGDTVEDYIGVPLHTEVEALGATTEKRYTDPGTSPDSEVINLVAEGQVDARCPEDFHDAVLSSSKAFATDQGGNGKRRGKKKERLPQAANCSPAAASLNKVKLAKKRGGRQRKADGLSSTEILTSSSSVNGLINTPSSKECSAEQVPLSRENELEVSGEVLTEEISVETKICVGGLDAELRSSGSQISKNPLPSTKSRGNGVNKGRSKVSDSAKSRRANGCKDRGNDRKSVKKNKAKGKSVCDHVFYKVDDPEIDENGKIDAGEDTAAEEVADLDTLSSGVMEQNLSPDNAWVRCDDCLKWRRIPVRLVESISQTHCQWICKDNMNKAFADCSFPQEKSNAEINAELGISDVDEDGCDAPSNYMELECRQTSVSKEYEFTRITTNQFLHRSRKTQTIDEIMVCYCKAPVAGRLGCGDECLNRMLNIECVQGTCPCGDHCSNQQFQKRNYARMTWERCGKKGFGLRLDEDISRGQFLIEYVGEVLDVHAYEARQKDYASKGHKHFYFMTLDGSEVIDACAKGNLGRFINHSCDPNCRTEKWVVNGEICIGLFALRDIKKGEEVTFDYNYVRVVGAAAKRCYCGSPQCRGYIGGDPTSTEVVDQVDSDEEFPEPVMLEDGRVGGGLKNKISKTNFFGLSKDREIEFKTAVGNLEVATEIKDLASQLTPAMSLSPSASEMNGLPGDFSSSSQQVETSPKAEDVMSQPTPAVQQEISIEETMNKSLYSSQKLRTSPTSTPTKILPDDVMINRKSKSAAAENKRVFVKSRFIIKTPHQSSLIKKGKSAGNLININKVQTIASKPQFPLIKPKKLIESTSNGHFEAVQEKLNELLDSEGGISKRKDAPKGYLKLLLLTAASGAIRSGEAIQSNRELSMILDALLKTRSRVVLMDIINKNGLRMLHNIMKQYRSDFKKIPILRKLLKVLEHLAVREILTLEHISGGPPCPGMESFTESMLSLTEHDDKQVHQIARSFRDRWIPRHIRKHSYMDRDDGRMEIHRGSNCNRVSASHNHWHDQGVRHTEALNGVVESNLAMTSGGTAVHEDNSVNRVGSGTRTRKRKTRWDQPAVGNIASSSLQHIKQNVNSGLVQQYESNPLLELSKEVPVHVDKAGREYSYCPHCVRNYRWQDESSSADDRKQNIHEDVPPGFSSPINAALASNASSTVADPPQQNVFHLKFPVGTVVGLPQKKFNSRFPVSYGIPLSVMQQLGSPLAETVESWVIAPGMPFHPFPPLPPLPSCKKGTQPSCAVSSMEVDCDADRGQQDSHDPTTCPNENSPSMSGANQPDVNSPCPNDHQTFKRARGFSYDLGRRYFKQQKWNKVSPPWVRNRNGWGCVGDNSRGGMCSTDMGSLTNEQRNS
ncbi:hypothetical protein Peur_013805 [Populus x canadensis]